MQLYDGNIAYINECILINRQFHYFSTAYFIGEE
jgi:hypothetical protein